MYRPGVLYIKTGIRISGSQSIQQPFYIKAEGVGAKIIVEPRSLDWGKVNFKYSVFTVYLYIYICTYIIIIIGSMFIKNYKTFYSY